MRAGISESTRPAAAKEPDRPQIINNRPLAVSLPRPDEFLRLKTGGSYDISIWWRNTMISMSLSVSVRREDRSRPRIRHRPRQQRVKATADHGRWHRTLPVQGSDRGFGALQLMIARWSLAMQEMRRPIDPSLDFSRGTSYGAREGWVSTPSQASVATGKRVHARQLNGKGQRQDETAQKRKVARGGHGRRRALVDAGLPAFRGSQHGSGHHRRGESGHHRRDVLRRASVGNASRQLQPLRALGRECTRDEKLPLPVALLFQCGDRRRARH